MKEGLLNQQKIFILIPVFNEEKVILEVIRSIKKKGYKNLIIIDDGSTDKTFYKANKGRVTVVRHVINRGKGAALKTGIEAAIEMNADIIVTMDGDGQHDPSEVLRLIREINKGYDVILGSRNISFSQMPISKVIANYIGNFFTYLLYGVWVKDSQCGLRAYSKKAISLISTTTDRYEYDSEIIREIARNMLKFKEIQIGTIYTNYSLNKKTRQSFLTGLETAFRMAIRA